MSVSQTTIVNMTLARLTQGKVQSIDELNSRGAEFCNLFYEPTRRYLLRKFNWGFAKTVGALALTTNDPFNWTYEYQIPAGCLRIRCLAPEGGTGLVRTFANGEMVYAPDPNNPAPVPYDVLGDKIVTNLDEAYCFYTQDIEDETKFDPMFVDVFAWRMAFEVSMPLTGKYVLRDKMEDQYEKALLRATAVNANERHRIPNGAQQSDLVRARQ